VTYVPGRTGSLQELFAGGPGGSVLMDYESPDGAWSGWHSLGGTGLVGPVTYAPGGNGYLQELFAAGPGLTVLTDNELANGTWSGWHNLAST
jgi:hypothetical protein